MPLDESLAQLIKETQAKVILDATFIEKDLYVYRFLKRFYAQTPPLVFKGGTSLSMCYGAIRRFSEDIDLSYNEAPISRGGKRNAKEAVLEAIQDVGLTLTNPGQQRSRRILNKFLCSFPSACFSGEQEIRIELAAQAPSFPTEKKMIQPIVGKELQKEGRIELVRQFGLEPIEVTTQAPIRTFVDKAFAICDYYLTKRTRRLSRHVYDLYCLLDYVPLNEDFLVLFKRIAGLRKGLEYCPSAKEGVVISACLKEICDTRYYEDDFHLLTQTLLYEPVTYNTCIKAVYLIADFLEKHGL